MVGVYGAKGDVMTIRCPGSAQRSLHRAGASPTYYRHPGLLAAALVFRDPHRSSPAWAAPSSRLGAAQNKSWRMTYGIGETGREADLDPDSGIAAVAVLVTQATNSAAVVPGLQLRRRRASTKLLPSSLRVDRRPASRYGEACARSGPRPPRPAGCAPARRSSAQSVALLGPLAGAVKEPPAHLGQDSALHRLDPAGR